MSCEINFWETKQNISKAKDHSYFLQDILLRFSKICFALFIICLAIAKKWMLLIYSAYGESAKKANQMWKCKKSESNAKEYPKWN